MSVFAVIAPAEEPRLDLAVEHEFPGDFFKVAPGQFFVAGDKITTAEVNQRLGARDGKIGYVVILAVSNYTGWHNKNLWEWLAPRMSGASPAGANG